MQSRRILLLRRMDELEKLEDTSTAQTFKYVVERCSIRLGRKPMVYEVRNGTEDTAIIRGTQQIVAICQLRGGEVAPEELPRVRWAYI